MDDGVKGTIPCEPPGIQDRRERPMTHFSAQRLDRAVGAVVASAAGDALGSQYEFGPSLSDDVIPQFGTGCFGHAVGEWTDDTSMAMPILRALADGRRMEDEATLDGIVSAWRDWSRTAKDVGTQTRSVLSHLTEPTAAAALDRSEGLHRRTGRTSGNGSLMRTGPLALGYLDRDEAALAFAAGQIARLTHWDDDNADACVIWCLAIRHAVLTGELDVRAQLTWLPRDRRASWARILDEALEPGIHPRAFRDGNGWVVRALQGALAAVAGARSLRDAVERAVRGGGDADTVAAIAGSLAGAVYGGSAVPLAWKRRLHGWPGLRAEDLVRLGERAARSACD